MRLEKVPRKTCRIICIVVLFQILLFNPAFADERPILRIGRLETLPFAGIKVKSFKESTANPLPAINVIPLKNSKGDKLEAYLAEELWFHEQCMGRWGNDLGTLTIGKMTLDVPENVPKIWQDYVTKEAFDEWKKKEESKFSDEDIIPWLQVFTNSKIKPEPEPVKKNSPRNVTVYKYYPEEENDSKKLYLVSPQKKPEERIVLFYELSNKAIKDKSEKAILQSLQSLVFYSPRESEKKGKELTTTKSTEKKDRSPEYLASRENVINNIRNLKDWWYLETENFIIAANLKDKKTVREIQSDIEKSRSVYERFYPIKAPLKAVSVAKIFQERKDYVLYVGDDQTQGLWMSSKKELVISPVDWGGRKDRREILLKVLYHEGFHQYIHYAADEICPQPWFNEGNAEFFEDIEFKGKDKFKIETPQYLDHIGRLVQRGDVNISKLIDMDYEAFYGPNRDDNYVLAWGLMFFLHKGAPILKKKNDYFEIPARYYDAVTEIRDPVKATKIVWEGIDMNEFNKDFTDFWNSKSLIKKAVRYDPLKAGKK